MSDLLLLRKRLIVFDGFNRADNALSLGATDTGQAWSVVAGTWGISAGCAIANVLVDTVAEVVVDSGVFDCCLNVTLTTISTINSGTTRITFRHADVQNEWAINANSGDYVLAKRVNNVNTGMGSYAYTPKNGDRLKVAMQNTNIKVYLNGNLIISVIDSFNQTATRHGLRAYAGVDSKWDNFTVEAI